MISNTPFLVMPVDMAADYKLSDYNLYIDEKSGTIFNTRTTSVVSFDDKVLQTNQIADLLELGIIVKKADKEFELIKSEYDNRDYYCDSLHLIIAVTLKCQFRCFYCYENHPELSLSDNTIDSILNEVRQNARVGRNISIDWYGGEPLLEFELIESLSRRIIDICLENGVQYTASIITNGLLMTPEISSKFSALFIKKAQVTLDGTQSVHDERRRLIDGKTSFVTIFKNIVYTCKNTDCLVTLRINVDKENINEAYSLVEMFSQEEITNLDFTLGMLKTFGCGQQCKSCGTLFTMKEFANEFLSFREYLRKKGFERSCEKMQPVYKINTCSLDSPNSYVIDPSGFIYKCISYVGRKELSIGNINDLFDRNAHNKYSPFMSKKCSECIYLPICKGACLHYTCMNPDSPQCDVWKYIVDSFILNDYTETE